MFNYICQGKLLCHSHNVVAVNYVEIHFSASIETHGTLKIYYLHILKRLLWMATTTTYRVPAIQRLKACLRSCVVTEHSRALIASLEKNPCT